MSHDAIARQPKGIPAGGQFAPDLHAEPDVVLAAPAAPAATDPFKAPSPAPFATGEDRDAHMFVLEGQIAKLRREYARTGMVSIAREIRALCPDVASVELKEDEYKSSRMACEAAYNSDHEPLGEEVTERIDAVVRYYDPDFYTPLLHEEIGLDEAAAWHPSKDD